MEQDYLNSKNLTVDDVLKESLERLTNGLYHLQGFFISLAKLSGCNSSVLLLDITSLYFAPHTPFTKPPAPPNSAMPLLSLSLLILPFLVPLLLPLIAPLYTDMIFYFNSFCFEMKLN